MNKDLEILFNQCSGFEMIHNVIQHKEPGNSFDAHSYIFAIIYNFIKDEDVSRQVIHEYFKEYHPGYDEEETNYQTNRAKAKRLKPILCETLQKEGYCKQLCSNIRDAKSPIAILYKSKHIPKLKFGQDLRGILKFEVKHKISMSEHRVLLCLISYKNTENNVVYPSIDTITKETKLSSKSVKNALNKLIEKGLVSKFLQRRYGAYPFNKYTLSKKLLEGYKPKLGELFSKHKVGVKSTPMPKANTSKEFKT
jgi:predicted transcriptional regulator